MKNIKNLMKVAAVVGDGEKILRDLYEDLGEYLGAGGSNNTTAPNPKLSVIGRKFNHISEIRDILEKLGYEQVNRTNYALIEEGIYISIEYNKNEDNYIVRENK